MGRVVSCKAEDSIKVFKWMGLDCRDYFGVKIIIVVDFVKDCFMAFIYYSIMDRTFIQEYRPFLVSCF